MLKLYIVWKGAALDGSFVFSLFACLFVVFICIVGSIAATLLLGRSMLRRTTGPADTSLSHKSATSLAHGSAPGTLTQVGGVPGMALNDAIELRNLVLRTIAPRPQEIVYLARARHPHATPDELARKIIAGEASKCGFIGFVTGVPGFSTLR